MRSLLAGAVALLLLAGCTSDEPEQTAPTPSAPAAGPTGPLDETALARTTLGVNDGSRVTGGRRCGESAVTVGDLRRRRRVHPTSESCA